jgi:hypothetical protein
MIVTKQTGNVWRAQVRGSGGWVFADSEELAEYRARTWPVLHRKPERERVDVWKGFRNSPTLADLM